MSKSKKIQDPRFKISPPSQNILRVPAQTKTYSTSSKHPSGMFPKRMWIENTAEILASFCILTNGGIASFQNPKTKKYFDVEASWNSRAKKMMLTLDGRSDVIQVIAERLYKARAYDLACIRSFTIHRSHDYETINQDDLFGQTVFSVSEMVTVGSSIAWCLDGKGQPIGFLSANKRGSVLYSKAGFSGRPPVTSPLADQTWIAALTLADHKTSMSTEDLLKELEKKGVKYFGLPSFWAGFGEGIHSSGRVAAAFKTAIIKLGLDLAWTVSFPIKIKQSLGITTDSIDEVWDEIFKKLGSYGPNLKSLDVQMVKRVNSNITGMQLMLVMDKYVPYAALRKKLKTKAKPTVRILSWKP